MLGEIRSWQPDHGPAGVRLMEIHGRPLCAIYLPRTALEAASTVPEVGGSGVFFLLGPGTPTGERPRVFIGSSQDLPGGLLAHGGTEPFSWEVAVAIPLSPPKVARFHKELIKLLQFHCHRQAVRARTHQVGNPAPSPPSLVPAFVDSDMRISQTAIQTLLFALGHPVLGRETSPPT